MLELQDVSLQAGKEPDEQRLLSEVSARFPKRHLGAILGPSGCGKSTLVKVIAGVREPTDGTVEWDGRNLAEEGDLAAHEIGYVPQFGITYELLTVGESVDAALQLRVRGVRGAERQQRVENILRDVGLAEISDRRISLLSGGQKRRLALALEIVSAPHLLLCDEVTSGLDPKAEDEIVRLLHHLSRREQRIVLSVTHSLRHLALYDSVLVLYHGCVAYHGAPGTLLHYFNVQHADELFPRLAMRTPHDWHRSWLKHRAAYYHEQRLDGEKGPAATEHGAKAAEDTRHESGAPPGKAPPPGGAPVHPTSSLAPMQLTPLALVQFKVLVARRWRLFLRDRGQLALQLALLFGFPCLVVIFALDGLPQLQSLADSPSGNALDQIQSELQRRTDYIRAGGLVSGLIMFQVILLALIGSNNGAREIAGERLIFEKEKFAGVRPLAYVASKAAFLGVLVLAQSIWMGAFVNMFVRFPGDMRTQLLLLMLVNAGMTSVCLALSSVTRTPENASLVCIYLVGFQLPLSGAVLALPPAIGWFTRPFIASYWGWSGFIQTLQPTRFYEAIQLVTQTNLAPLALCVWVLVFHIVLGFLVAYTGCKSSRWD